MNIYKTIPTLSFRAKMAQETRQMINRHTPLNERTFETEFDKTIANSALGALGDNITVSCGIYKYSDYKWNGESAPVGQVNATIQGKKISILLPPNKNASKTCPAITESAALYNLCNEKTYRRDFLGSIKQATTEQIKTMLAQEYIKSCAEELADKADSSTYDKIISGEISFQTLNQ